jgi:hypothetical protein
MNFTEKNPSSKANSYLASQKFPADFGNRIFMPEFTKKKPPHVPVLSQINPVHAPILFLEKPF